MYMDQLTVILSVWKRNNLESQIEAVLSNTLAPDRIMVYQNEAHIDISNIVKKFNLEHFWSVNFNHRYHSRFSIPLFVESKFFAIYDDDCIPGTSWHAHAKETLEELNVIVGSNGRSYFPEINKQIPTGGISNEQFSDRHTFADFVGHAWFVKREHIFNMWSKPPLTLDTGEDIHLSLVNKLYFDIATCVPAQPVNRPELWGDLKPELGTDKVASYKTLPQHKVRNNLLRKWNDVGWMPTYKIKKNGSNNSLILRENRAKASKPERTEALKKVKELCIEFGFTAGVIRDALAEEARFNSGSYWENRYSARGNSGDGSYGRLAEFKAEIINEFVRNEKIGSVIEFGCGDGNQLSLADYSTYIGFDVSYKSIELCNQLFIGDSSKSFLHVNKFDNQNAELVISLDVIYHLVEDEVYEKYMTDLFKASTKFVVVYSTNSEDEYAISTPHLRNRQFTDWVDGYATEFKLVNIIPNKYPYDKANPKPNTSSADFFIYQKSV